MKVLQPCKLKWIVQLHEGVMPTPHARAVYSIVLLGILMTKLYFPNSPPSKIVPPYLTTAKHIDQLNDKHCAV